MENTNRLIAEELANNNKVIEFKDKSVFGIFDMPNYSEVDINTIGVNIGNGLVNDLVKIKDQYRPIMLDYIKAVKDKVDELKPVDPASLYTIVELKIPGFVTELKAKNILPSKSSYVELPMSDLVIDLSEDDIMELLTVSNTVLNSHLTDVTAKYSRQEIKTIANKYLLNVSNSNNDIDMINMRVTGNSDEVIIMYAIVDNLLTTKPSSVRMSESNYKSIISVFRSVLLNALAKLEEAVTTGAKLKRLVVSIKDKYTIVVNSVLYDKFIEEHSSEVILGLLINGVAGVNESRYDDIIINKDTYQKIWDKMINLNIVSGNRNKVKQYTVAYELALVEILQHIPEALEDDLHTSPKHAHEDVKALLDSMDRNQLTDVNAVARELVGNIMFPDTNFYVFTGYMMGYKQDNPKLSPEEAATLAGIDLVIDYVLQQVDIKES